MKLLQDQLNEISCIISELKETTSDLKDIITHFNRLQAKVSAIQLLGVDIEFTPEETKELAETAKLSPIQDRQEWRSGLNLALGTIVIRNGHNYQVIQGHVSQPSWTPENTPALFKMINEDYAQWVQPVGSHDAYMQGDKVLFEGRIYISEIDHNVWPPGTGSFWRLVE